MSGEDQKSWSPLSVEAMAGVLGDAPFPWWIAGGYAIELAVGRSFRTHGDIDVLLVHRDHKTARAFLADWDCWASDPPGTLRPWQVGESLAPRVHDIWCRRSADDPWRFQLMLDGSDSDTWVSRRDASIRLDLAALTRTTPNGIPYLAPEVQLFYKAKALRDRDDMDLNASLDTLGAAERDWLRDAIEHVYGGEHRWLEVLRRRV